MSEPIIIEIGKRYKFRLKKHLPSVVGKAKIAGWKAKVKLLDFETGNRIYITSDDPYQYLLGTVSDIIKFDVSHYGPSGRVELFVTDIEFI